jgi:glycosyltransferase involved in cell wall biosynthesis
LSTKISIITINLNQKFDLERTIKSVISQNYQDLEFIVIDGNSSDGSVEVINKYSTFITKWISEKDEGIYDAMNKGLNLSTGDWINFKNSGDVFFDEKVLNSIDFEKHNETDIFYGPSINDYGFAQFDQKKIYNLNLKLLFLGRVMPPHQSTFARSYLYQNYRFPIEYKIASDYDFILKMFLSKKNIVFDEVSKTIFKIGGVSTKNEIVTVKEKYKITKRYLDNFYVDINYLFLFLSVFIKGYFKKNIKLYTLVKKIQINGFKK